MIDLRLMNFDNHPHRALVAPPIQNLELTALDIEVEFAMKNGTAQLGLSCAKLTISWN